MRPRQRAVSQVVGPAPRPPDHVSAGRHGYQCHGSASYILSADFISSKGRASHTTDLQSTRD